MFTTHQNSISLIPNSEISQYVGPFCVPNNSSNCSYNVGQAISILKDNLDSIISNLDNIGGQDAQQLFNGIWQNILFNGQVAFQTNNNQMLDPNQIYDESVIDTEGIILHGMIGLDRGTFIERINQKQYCIINHSGETILLFRINIGEEPSQYILIDTHVRNGMILIRNFIDWINNFYDNYEYNMGVEVLPIGWFNSS